MGLFDRFRKPAAPETPAELFDALAQAVTSGDGERFESLCRAHTQAIVDAFEAWRTPGKGKPPEQMQALVQVLGQTAQYLDQALGRPEPWQLLTEPADGHDPFARFESARERISQRVEVIDFAGAVELAREQLASLDGLEGPGRDQQEELTRGLLGQLLRAVGQPEEATPHLEWTLARCQLEGDEAGATVYMRELHEADRDRGRPSAWRLRLAEQLERQGDEAGEAAWLRAVDERFPEGEPPLRMIAVIGGHRCELDAIDTERLNATGSVQMVFERNRQTLLPALRWNERGRMHGSEDEHQDAIACFVAAAEADPHDPESRYLHAFTLMRMNQPAPALALYDEVEGLAPGWFHARTWRSLARRQLDGQLAHEVVGILHALQDAHLPPKQQLELVSKAILQWPRVPELFLYRGQALAALGREAQEAYLAGLELADDLPATRSRLLQALGRYDELLTIEGANAMALAAARLQRALSGA